jgi:hypothetical protein
MLFPLPTSLDPALSKICLIHLKDKRKKYEPPVPTRVGKKQKKLKGPEAANKLPQGTYDSSTKHHMFSQHKSSFFLY